MTPCCVIILTTVVDTAVRNTWKTNLTKIEPSNSLIGQYLNFNSIYSILNGEDIGYERERSN